MQFVTREAAKSIVTQSVGVGVHGIGRGAVVFVLKLVHRVAVIEGVSVGVGVQSKTANGNSTRHSVGVGVGVGVQVAI